MKEVWKYSYEGNDIEVKNDRATQLIINGQVQDQKKGVYFSTVLNGKLPNGEAVSASLGGFFRIECTLLVGEKPLVPVAVQNVRSTS